VRIALPYTPAVPGPLALTFVRSATSVDQLPDSPAEVAFVGRSNVGKSSLINALAHRKQLAQVSNTPGRTQLINLFTLPSGATVVDLPGYGYAAVPGRVKQNWQAMIEGYLLDREPLVQTFILVDGEIGPTKLDVQMLAWARASGIAHTVVATKIDKVKSSKRQTRKRELAEGCSLEVGDVVWVSATAGTGIEDLRSLVRAHLRETRRD
jgi:GTP-binding protein